MLRPAPISAADFALLCEVIASVARSSGLPPQEAEDFGQNVHLRLMERNYAPLAAFSGRASLRTYLTVVVRRLLLDWRNHRFGKWRPSARAKRLGPVAVALDRLMSRDGHPLEEAVALLKGRTCPHSQPLRELAGQLPRRQRVQTVVPDDLDALGLASFDDPVEAEQALAARHRVIRRLRRACRKLSVEDRRLLFLRFKEGLSMRAIASKLGAADDKPLYRRVDRIVGSLRRAIEHTVSISVTH